MQIDPKLAMVIKIVLTLANAIGNGSLVLTGIVSVQTATAIVAICQVLVSVLGIFMSAFSSSAPGPLAPQDPAVVKAATAVANLPLNAPEWSPQVKAAKSIATQAVADHKP